MAYKESTRELSIKFACCDYIEFFYIQYTVCSVTFFTALAQNDNVHKVILSLEKTHIIYIV